MSIPLHVLLKDDPNLEGNVADDKADASASIWPGICLTVFSRDCWLHGPPTCVYTGWTFLKSSCYSGYTGLANRAGWQLAGDLMPRESPDNS